MDSNAWKCLADFANNKPRLTSEMKYFAKAIERCRLSGNFAFPIGLPTFFEMDAMTNPETHEAFVRMVDGLSHGCCTTPFPERIGLEVTRLIKGDLSEMKDPADFVVSPIELLGIPVLSFGLTELKDVDEATFNKAFYDVISRLPFSAQLQIAKQHDTPKWDNTRGTAELNRGKLEHQTEIANLNTGILIELRGIISAWREAEHVELSDNTINAISINALYHWHQNPTSKAFPTIRILSADRKSVV